MDAQSAGQSPQEHNGIDVNEKAKHHPSRLVNNSALHRQVKVSLLAFSS